jgi:hypothetical protein
VQKVTLVLVVRRQQPRFQELVQLEAQKVVAQLEVRRQPPLFQEAVQLEAQKVLVHRERAMVQLEVQKVVVQQEVLRQPYLEALPPHPQCLTASETIHHVILVIVVNLEPLVRIALMGLRLTKTVMVMAVIGVTKEPQQPPLLQPLAYQVHQARVHQEVLVQLVLVHQEVPVQEVLVHQVVAPLRQKLSLPRRPQ